MLELQLLGGLTIDGPGLTDSAAVRRRHPMALLALLAAAAPRAVGRDRLMAFLWPDSDSDRASNSLRQTLFRLRRDLGEELFLPESAAGIQLDPSKLTVDLWAFRQAVADGDALAAVDAYGGPFLDGFHIPGIADFDRWVETERDRIQREYVRTLESLACSAADAGNLDEAVVWRRRQAAADPFSSRVALALLEALTAAGDRTGALKYAGVYERIVREHLEADPDPSVAHFVAALREGRVVLEAPPRPSPQPEAAAEPPEIPVTAEPRGTDADAKEATPVAAGQEATSRRSQLAAALILVMFAVVVGRSIISGDSADPAATPAANGDLIVLGSGLNSVAARDQATRITACEGPACPDGPFPQDAYVVPKHTVYAAPVGGTRFISPVADGTTLGTPGYPCCTTATFETDFDLPVEAVSGRISVTALADNQATLWINGAEFGSHDDRQAFENYGSDPETFATTFLPDPSGENRLRIRLWNGGGAVALQYHAIVTYDVVFDADEDGTPDDDDAFPESDFRPTVIVRECDTGAINRLVPGSSGATLADVVSRALESADQGQDVVRDVSALATQWQEAGLISDSDRGRIVSCAAESGTP